MPADKEEKLLYQYIMNYKAYRRKMILTRVSITLAIAAGLSVLSVIRLWIGLSLGISALFIGAIAVIAGLHNEKTYMIFNTRFVIKNKDMRVSVPLDSITSVRYHRAFYEKSLSTGTIIITAKTASGKRKKYKMPHVFAAREGLDYLQSILRERT